MGNFLVGQTSPYLLQHAENPVNWYPWCEEAFARAEAEDKPVFLSIGYSTCHWCHVMAHESFEDEQVAEVLNRHFIPVKVDKEERPDIDAIYMAACQAFTGSGGWPATLFLTPDKKPFYAGTYFPKMSRFGQIGLLELLEIIREKWTDERQQLLHLAEDVVAALAREERRQAADGDWTAEGGRARAADGESARASDGHSPLLEVFGRRLVERGIADLARQFDGENGGFGRAPKFPAPHNLLLLLRYHEKYGGFRALEMAEKTLTQMYRGGLFDHIAGGFCRYSTDDRFLIPHFEKMLYDNALLIMAYAKAYQITKKELYRTVAERTAAFVLEEMCAPDGGFYSALDADAEGEEGKFYVFSPEEVSNVLGEEEGAVFNRRFGITKEGNFEGKSVPNLLGEDWSGKADSGAGPGSGAQLPRNLETLRDYRKKRCALHLDDKILTGWNGLMAAALCRLCRVTQNPRWLEAACRAETFVLNKLSEEDVLFVSYRKGRSAQKGFLEDYAFQIFALLDLYECTWEESWLKAALRFYEKAVGDFYDLKCGGFYLYGKEHEEMILRPKETYDGAVFSGNSAMAHNLMRLGYLTKEGQLPYDFQKLAAQQVRFLATEAERYPAGQTMFLTALLDILDPPDQVTVVPAARPEQAEAARPALSEATGGEADRAALSENAAKKTISPENRNDIVCAIPLDTLILPRQEGNPGTDGETAFYVCRGHRCLPPVYSLDALRKLLEDKDGL